MRRISVTVLSTRGPSVLTFSSRPSFANGQVQRPPVVSRDAWKLGPATSSSNDANRDKLNACTREELMRALNTVATSVLLSAWSTLALAQPPPPPAPAPPATAPPAPAAAAWYDAYSWWWIILVVIVVGAAVWWWSNRRGTRI